MSNYYPDHLAWQQRCGQEIHRKNQHDEMIEHNLIKPITQSKYNIKLMRSGYTHGYKDLRTLDEIRDSLAGQSDRRSQLTSSSLVQRGSRSQQKGRRLKSSAAQRDKGPHQGNRAQEKRAGANVSQNRKNPLAIYDLIKQDVKVHEGLQYRGKYCAKSKVREQTFKYQDEFGQPVARYEDGRGTVQSKRRPKSSNVYSKTPKSVQRKYEQVDQASLYSGLNMKNQREKYEKSL